MVAYLCNPNTQEAEARGLTTSLKPGWATYQELVLKQTTTKQY